MNRKTKYLLPLVIILIFIFIITKPLTLLSPPLQTIYENGEIWYYTTLNIDSSSESLYLSAHKVDGIEPKKDIVVTFSVLANKCRYVLNHQSNSGFEYFTLRNPERIINIKVDTSESDPQILDGTMVSMKFLDRDNKGELKIKLDGALQGKYDCPNYETVVIYGNKIYDRFSFERCFTIAPFYPTSACMIQDYDFTKEFSGTEISSGAFTGNLPPLTLGSGVVTVMANADFFDAVTYSPPLECNPEIIDIVTNDKIQGGKSGILSVNFRNTVENTCTVSVTPKSEILAFSPSIQYFNLARTGNVKFGFTAPDVNNDIKKPITITVCDTNSNNCDVKTEYITVTKSTTLYCGDGSCNPPEDHNNCPKDCTIDIICPDHSLANKGVCECVDGYKEDYENNKLVCVKDYPITEIMIILALIVIIAIIGMILWKKFFG